MPPTLRPSAGSTRDVRSSGMSYLELKLWGAGAFVLAAFVWGLCCGLTGRPLGRERPDIRTAQPPGQEGPQAHSRRAR